MNVLVTGANGFVGRHLCAYLAAEGISCRPAVRGGGGDGRTVAVGDIDGRTDWSRALASITAVVHLAARVHVMREKAGDPLAEFRRVNVDGSLNLARQAAEKGVGRFIFLSTIKVNGEETIDRPFRADDRPAPSDPYAISKLEAEDGLRRIAGETGMEAVIIRSPLVYGPGAGGNFARLLGLACAGWYLPLGGINNQRSLVGIDNLCSLISVCLAHPAAANRILLVSDGEDVSTPELIRHLAGGCRRPARLFPLPPVLLRLSARLLGREAELRRLTSSLQVDSLPTRRLLDWQPPVSLAQGIARCAAAAVRA